MRRPTYNPLTLRQAISSTRQGGRDSWDALKNDPRGTKESLHGRELQETVGARLMGRGGIRTFGGAPRTSRHALLAIRSGRATTRMRLIRSCKSNDPAERMLGGTTRGCELHAQATTILPKTAQRFAYFRGGRSFTPRRNNALRTPDELYPYLSATTVKGKSPFV